MKIELTEPSSLNFSDYETVTDFSNIDVDPYIDFDDLINDENIIKVAIDFVNYNEAGFCNSLNFNLVDWRHLTAIKENFLEKIKRILQTQRRRTNLKLILLSILGASISFTKAIRTCCLRKYDYFVILDERIKEVHKLLHSTLSKTSPPQLSF